MENKPYDYERDEALRDALKLVADRRDRVQFWDCGRSEGVVKCEHVADYLRDELRKVYGGAKQW